MLIGLGYKKQSGKDLVAKIMTMIKARDNFYPQAEVKAGVGAFYDSNRVFLQSLTNCYIKKFAGNLKHIVSLLTEVSSSQLEKDDQKNKTFPFLYKGEEITYRKALQVIGTEMFRDSFPEIWINSLLNNYNNKQDWIITDVRFKNEAEAIKKLGGVLIHIKRDTDNKDSHISETELDGYEWDHIIDNNGTIEALISKVENLKL